MNEPPVSTKARSEVECVATTLAEPWPGKLFHRDDDFLPHPPRDSGLEHSAPGLKIESTKETPPPSPFDSLNVVCCFYCLIHL